MKMQIKIYAVDSTSASSAGTASEFMGVSWDRVGDMKCRMCYERENKIETKYSRKHQLQLETSVGVEDENYDWERQRYLWASGNGIVMQGLAWSRAQLRCRQNN